MQLEVTTLEGRSLIFIVRPNTPLQRVFDAFCLRFSLSDGQFLCDGDRLCGWETPNSKEMESGDSITWYPSQRGD